MKLMHLKGIDRFKRALVCKSITLGYLRVPKFRNIFLDQITESKDASEGSFRSDDDDACDPALSLNIDELIDSHVLPIGTSIEKDSAMHKFIDW